jgi:hypothetical protein
MVVPSHICHTGNNDLTRNYLPREPLAQQRILQHVCMWLDHRRRAAPVDLIFKLRSNMLSRSFTTCSTAAQEGKLVGAKMPAWLWGVQSTGIWSPQPW